MYQKATYDVRAICKISDETHPYNFYSKLSNIAKTPTADKNIIKRLKYRYGLKSGAINALILWSTYKDSRLNLNYVEKIITYLSRCTILDNLTAYETLNRLKKDIRDSVRTEKLLFEYFNNHWKEETLCQEY